jgi:hypothetical protein
MRKSDLMDWWDCPIVWLDWPNGHEFSIIEGVQHHFMKCYGKLFGGKSNCLSHQVQFVFLSICLTVHLHFPKIWSSFHTQHASWHLWHVWRQIDNSGSHSQLSTCGFRRLPEILCWPSGFARLCGWCTENGDIGQLFTCSRTSWWIINQLLSDFMKSRVSSWKHEAIYKFWDVYNKTIWSVDVHYHYQ